jgi:hypothetical protein
MIPPFDPEIMKKAFCSDRIGTTHLFCTEHKEQVEKDPQYQVSYTKKLDRPPIGPWQFSILSRTTN